jgi:hypothetical protein
VFDALALLPIFVTGRAAQLPPHRARSAAPLLARVHAALRRETWLKAAPWARVPLGATDPDELRLLALPRAALPGLLAIELGIAWERTPTAWAPRFEAMVRVHEGTDAQGRLALVAPFRRAFTGRRPEERVFVLLPRMPSIQAARALVVRLARELTDRRLRIGGYGGQERRAERLEKTDRMPAAA